MATIKKKASKKAAKKAAPKKKASAKKKTAGKPAAKKSAKPEATATTTTPSGKPINNVKIRMYCLGTGDCFVLKFCNDDNVEFTMMIDCGSCQGGPKQFRPYVEHLAKYIENKVDLLVITHEHNDHVNGFAKCPDVFEKFDIGEAWFAWTEDPKDPTGAAKELQEKRKKMKQAFSMALGKINANSNSLKKNLANDFYAKVAFNNTKNFLSGLDTLAEINLPAAGAPGNSLPGMTKIKGILKAKNIKPKYLNPGDSEQAAGADNIKFHVLGPPLEREYIFKDGKEGVDVFHKKLSLNESSLAATAFLNSDSTPISDLPFSSQYLSDSVTAKDYKPAKKVMQQYNDPAETWRKIDEDWLNSAGSLALRLNSHINNTSLALAVEFETSKTKKVLLLPGDAEYGSWESWHDIKKWKPKKAGDKHFVEDLLNRTVFYKVGHHLSYNGTALQKGIMMMENTELAAMATLDRNRISKGWKSTMPNKFLLKELIKRCKGKLFIMDEFEIDDGPSKTFDPALLGKDYETDFFPTGERIYIQYTCKVD
jgi:hypothetical protein